MATSVHKSRYGPFWPLGLIAVPTPGTPVSIMSLVDAAGVNAPESATSSTSAEYTERAQQIIFDAFKAGAAPPRLGANTGNIYIVAKSVGAGGVDDRGVIIKVLAPGQSYTLGSSALVRNGFGLYSIFIDADTVADACNVTAIIQ
jgi:hypothetical protein